MAANTASSIALGLTSYNISSTDYDDPSSTTYNAHCYNYGTLMSNTGTFTANPIHESHGGLKTAQKLTRQSVRITTILYSCVVAALIITFGFGYDAGFPSPALHDLDQNKGKHTYFNKIIYHDTFNLYTAEISPKQLRGTFGSVIQLSAAFGVFVAQALGIILHYDWLSVVVLAVLLVFVILVSLTLKESPRWLIVHGKDLQATQVLAWLRGPRCNINQEQQEIKEQIVSERKLTLTQQLQAFSTRPVFHPLILSMGLMFFQQFTGIKMIVLNGQEIFEQAGVSDAAVTTALAIGAALTIATFCGVLLADILKRRHLLALSATTMCISMAVLSVHDFLQNEPYCDPDHDSKCKSNLQPLAITAMIAYTVGYSIGWCTLPWVQASELVPLRVRGTAVGIATSVNWISAATILFSFGSYQSLVKPWGAFLTFSVINFLALLFVIIFVPETKGKSLEEIERYFNCHYKSYPSL